MIGLIPIGRHSRLRVLLSSYVDGEVTADESRQVEAHLALCEECMSDLDALRATVGLLGRLPELDTSRSFALSAPPVPVRQPRSLAWASGLAASMAAVVLVVLLAGDAAGILTQSAADGVGPLAMESAPIMAADIAAPESVVEQAAAAPVAAAAAPAAAPAAAAAAAPAPPPAVAAAEAPPAPPPAPAAAAPAPQPDAATAKAAPTLGAVPTPEPDVEATRTMESVSEFAAAATTPRPEKAAIEAVGPQTEATASRAEPPNEGVGLPLRQIELATGAVILLSLAAAAWLARRRRSGHPWS